MLGAIVGDIVGSVYEFNNYRRQDFPLFQAESFFTDDTVLTVAVAETLLREDKDYVAAFKRYYQRYPNAGYGGMFHRWAASATSEPYNSWGNGSAMRVSPVGYVGEDLETVLSEAACSAAVTHNHPEGVKGAQATTAAIFLGRTGASKADIKAYISKTFKYDLNRTIAEIRSEYQFNESCQGTVPEAIIAFLESQNFEDAIRLAVSVGGDSDTLTCITGAIAEAFYGGVPTNIAQQARDRLSPDLLQVVDAFCDRYPVPVKG